MSGFIKIFIFQTDFRKSPRYQILCGQRDMAKEIAIQGLQRKQAKKCCNNFQEDQQKNNLQFFKHYKHSTDVGKNVKDR